MNGAGNVTGIAIWADVQTTCRAIRVRRRTVTKGQMLKSVFISRFLILRFERLAIAQYQWMIRYAARSSSFSMKRWLSLKQPMLFRLLRPRNRVPGKRGYISPTIVSCSFSLYVSLEIPFSLPERSPEDPLKQRAPRDIS